MTDIVLWYDNDSSNCKISDATYNYRSIVDILNKNSINFKIKNTDKSLNHLDLNFYIIELCNVHNNFDIFSLIPENTKTMLLNGLILVLYYPREGHDLDDWFLNIYKNILKNKLIQSQIYFVFGDIDFQENYNTFLSKNNIESFLHPISIDYFAGDYLDKVDIFAEHHNKNKNYDYLFYNGKLRPHRLYTVSELSARNILDKGLVSLTSSTHSGESFTLEQCIETLKTVNAYSQNLQTFVDKFEPMILDLDPSDFSQDNINHTTISHYEQTYFSVIGEANVTTRFVTEKIYKPIYNFHPFIIIGAPRILEYLKSKGYLTFEEMFDESYDLESNPVKRINMVISEIEKFTNRNTYEKQLLLEKIKYKLIHNREHYIKITKNNKVEELLKIFRKY